MVRKGRDASARQFGPELERNMRREPAKREPLPQTEFPSFSEGSRAIQLRSGRTLGLRPIHAEDEAALVEMVARSTPEDRRFRFMSAVQPRLGWLSSRLAHVDQVQHIALAAYDPDAGDREILGVVRLVLGPDGRTGDIAIMVRSDLKGQRLGYGLMREILRRADELGLSGVEGEVLAENRAMLGLVRAVGGRSLPSNGYFATVCVRIDLPFAPPELHATTH
jgi:acetyltransferase